MKNPPATQEPQETRVQSLGREDSPWRRKGHPIPVFWPGESFGQRSLAGCSLWGSQRVGRVKPAQPAHSVASWGLALAGRPAGRLAFLERPGHVPGVRWEALPALNRGAAMLTHGCYPRVMGACSRGLIHTGCWSRGEGRESQPAPSERSPGSELAWPARRMAQREVQGPAAQCPSPLLMSPAREGGFAARTQRCRPVWGCVLTETAHRTILFCF